MKLGLLPGAGGTQRLPRLIGAAQALKLVTEGNPVSASDALALGLVDEIAESGDVLSSREGPGARARGARREAAAHPRPHGSHRRAWRTGGIRGGGGRHPEARRRQSERRRLRRSSARCGRASFEEGMAVERSHFRRLLEDPRSKAQRHVFFAEREARQDPRRAARTPPTLPVSARRPSSARARWAAASP